MKKTALIITLLLVLVIAGYLVYDKFYPSSDTTLWELVPENAALVFESRTAGDTYQKLTDLSIWQSLKGMDPVNGFDEQLQAIDSASGKSSIRSLTEGEFLVSCHVVSKNSADFMLYLDLDAPGSQRTLTSLLNEVEDNPDLQQKKRIYQEMEIHEIDGKEGIFSYIIYDNKFVGSYTPFLIEDVIRLISDASQRSFLAANTSLKGVTKLSKDDGNLYLNTANFGKLLATFLDAQHRADATGLDNLAQSTFMDLTLNDKSVMMNGFTFAGPNSFLSTFDDQPSVAGRDLKYLIPNNAAYVYQFGFSDPLAWKKRLDHFWQTTDPNYVKQRQEFFDVVELSPEELFSTFDGFISMLAVENPGERDYTYLGIINAGDTAGLMNQLNSLGEALAKANGDSVYVEHFGEVEIRELDIDNFPYCAIGPMFNGYEVTFYTQLGDKVILSPSIVALKDLLQQRSTENTWGRSVRYNSFLESTLEETNVTLYVNTTRAWEHILDRADQRWGNFASKYSEILRGFGLISCQFSRLDNSYYTSVVMNYDPAKKQNIDRMEPASVWSAQLDTLIASKPYVVKNHITNTLETMVQDSSHSVYLISGNGEASWSRRMNGPIIGDIRQLDFYKNDKLQYFFATPGVLHLIDRLGNSVEGYPVELDYTIKFVSVIDYDNSQRYRLLTVDDQGNLRMYDKEGHLLEGWDPLAAGGRLSSAPFHIRVRGKDFILAIEAGGTIHAWSRKGEEYQGFPIRLDERVETVPFVRQGPTLDKTLVTIIDKGGKQIEFDLNGSVVRSEQLYKPTTNTYFSIIPDVLQNTYLVARFEGRRMVLLDHNQNEILAKDYLSDRGISVQFYDFGSDVRMYVVADPGQGFTYIYDQWGKLVGSRPLDSGKEIGMLYSELNKEFTIYYVSGSSLLVKKF